MLQWVVQNNRLWNSLWFGANVFSLFLVFTSGIYLGAQYTNHKPHSHRKPTSLGRIKAQVLFEQSDINAEGQNVLKLSALGESTLRELLSKGTKEAKIRVLSYNGPDCTSRETLARDRGAEICWWLINEGFVNADHITLEVDFVEAAEDEIEIWQEGCSKHSE